MVCSYTVKQREKSQASTENDEGVAKRRTVWTHGCDVKRVSVHHVISRAACTVVPAPVRFASSLLSITNDYLQGLIGTNFDSIFAGSNTYLSYEMDEAAVASTLKLVMTRDMSTDSKVHDTSMLSIGSAEIF